MNEPIPKDELERYKDIKQIPVALKIDLKADDMNYEFL